MKNLNPRVQLSSIFKTFKFYGVDLENVKKRTESRLSFWRVIPLVSIAIMNLIGFSILFVYSNGLSQFQLGLKQFLYIYAMIEGLLFFVHTCNFADDYHEFLNALLKTVTVINQKNKRHNFIEIVERMGVWVTYMTLGAALIIGIATIYDTSILVIFFAKDGDPLKNSILMKLSLGCYVFWYCIARTYRYFFSIFVIFICNTLTQSFDFYFENVGFTNTSNGKTVRLMSIIKYKYQHHQLCLLLQKANRLLATYIMVFITSEIVAIIYYSKNTFESVGLSLAFEIADATSRIAMLGLTIWNISEANLRVSKYLPPPPQDKEDIQNTKKHLVGYINYIMYYNERVTNEITLNFGEFFPITKNFYLTICGTVITYTLFARDVSKN